LHQGLFLDVVAREMVLALREALRPPLLRSLPEDVGALGVGDEQLSTPLDAPGRVRVVDERARVDRRVAVPRDGGAGGVDVELAEQPEPALRLLADEVFELACPRPDGLEDRVDGRLRRVEIDRLLDLGYLRLARQELAQGERGQRVALRAVERRPVL